MEATSSRHVTLRWKAQEGRQRAADMLRWTKAMPIRVQLLRSDVGMQEQHADRATKAAAEKEPWRPRPKQQSNQLLQLQFHSSSLSSGRSRTSLPSPVKRKPASPSELLFLSHGQIPGFICGRRASGVERCPVHSLLHDSPRSSIDCWGNH